MIPSRARHALFAGAAATLAWAAAEELAGKKTVKMTALLGFAAAFAGMATSSVKSQATEQRVNGLANRTATLESGTIGGVTFTNLSFLAGLNKAQSPGGLATDPNSGTTWASGERASYINTPINAFNSLLGTLISNGFMNSA